MMTIEEATDAEVFETFLVRVLARKLRPGDIVMLDNVGAHKSPTSDASSRPQVLECCSSRRTLRT